MPFEKARLHVSDVGLQRGYSIFDYMISHHGKIPFLQDYLDRFCSSAKSIGMEPPVKMDELKERIEYLNRKNNLARSGFKLLLTGGYSDDLFTPSTPNLLLLNVPMPYHPGDFIGGIRLLTLEYLRFKPEIKTTFYLPSISLLPELKKRGALEVLYHHGGLVSETTRANIQWSTSGDGAFSQPNEAHTQYQPGQNDIQNGVVELTITASSGDPCNLMVSSSLQLTIEGIVLVVDLNDEEVMLGEDVTLSIEVTGASDFQWYGPLGPIPDATGSSLMINNATYEDAGEYYCEFGNGCTTQLSSTATILVYEVQQFSIPEGWSGMSTWLVPFDNDINVLFDDVMDDLMLISNDQLIFSPVLGLELLTHWNPQGGYKVRFAADVTIEFKGVANNNLVYEAPPGWSYLPVISKCPVNVEELFTGVSEIQIIKEVGGSGVYWPALNVNSIVALQPGKAYMLRASNHFDIVFPLCDDSKSVEVITPEKPVNVTTWNNVRYTGASHLIAFDQKLVDELGAGNIIGAFTSSGLCAGITVVSANDMALTVFANDQFTNISDGFMEDEEISFRLFEVSAGNVYDLEVAFDDQFIHHCGNFKTNGISRVIGVKTSATAVQDYVEKEINIFPNPTSGEIWITGVDGFTLIEVYSSDGRLLQKQDAGKEDESSSLSLAGYPAGIYHIRIIRENTILVKKIIKH